MGGEVHLDPRREKPKLLLYLWDMPVGSDLIGNNILGHIGIVAGLRRLNACARDPRFGVIDHPIHQPSMGERCQGQDGSRRIATRVTDKLCLCHLRMKLRQAKDSIPWSAVFHAIGLLEHIHWQAVIGG